MGSLFTVPFSHNSLFLPNHRRPAWKKRDSNSRILQPPPPLSPKTAESFDENGDDNKDVENKMGEKGITVKGSIQAKKNRLGREALKKNQNFFQKGRGGGPTPVYIFFK